MKTTKTILLISAVILIAGCGGKKECTEVAKKDRHKCPKMAEVQNQDEERLIYYTCPMESHKHIRSREAGKCEECGMTLVAGVTTSEEKMDYYGCPMLMHSHIRSDKPGTCDQCGMKLLPMRLAN